MTYQTRDRINGMAWNSIVMLAGTLLSSPFLFIGLSLIALQN